jgi:peptide/nickel transport system permease protein
VQQQSSPIARPPASVRGLMASRTGRAAVAVLVVVVLAAILAPWLTAYGEAQIISGSELLAPSLSHPFGTDVLGRDVLTRVLHGGRVSLGVALLATVVAATLGTAVGAAAGYAGGRTDALLMRGVDTLLALPRVLLLIGLLAVWPQLPLRAFILVLGMTAWFPLSRLVRADVRAVAGRDHVLAARALGGGHLHILVRHVLPNIAGTVLVAAPLIAGGVIVLEAGLSFLGVGVQPPTASWGSIAYDGFEVASSAWWVALFPGVAIAVTVTAINLLGDVLRDALDPHQLPRR